jgi:hypothetical protein
MMKRLILTTTVTLPDEDEHFIYKYLQANGHSESLIAQAKNTGHFKMEADSNGITLETNARIYDLEQETSP